MPENAILKKMRLKPGQKLLLLEAPEALAEALQAEPDLIVYTKPAPAEAALLFARNQAALQAVVAQALPHLPHDALLWIAYPKGSSKVRTDINRDSGWNSVAEAGLEGVAQIAIDEIWSALRFRPAALVKSSRSSTPPVSGQSRELTVPEDLLEALQQHPQAKAVFEKFAYSHRKEYVQWIEEAKKPETRTRRIEKTVSQLEAGQKVR